MRGQLITYLDHHLCHLLPGAPDEPFDPFAGAAASLLSPPRAEPSVPPHPREIPLLPDYNNFFQEKIVVANSYLNQRGV